MYMHNMHNSSETRPRHGNSGLTRIAAGEFTSADAGDAEAACPIRTIQARTYHARLFDYYIGRIPNFSPPSSSSSSSSSSPPSHPSRPRRAPKLTPGAAGVRRRRARIDQPARARARPRPMQRVRIVSERHRAVIEIIAETMILPPST